MRVFLGLTVGAAGAVGRCRSAELKGLKRCAAVVLGAGVWLRCRRTAPCDGRTVLASNHTGKLYVAKAACAHI